MKTIYKITPLEVATLAAQWLPPLNLPDGWQEMKAGELAGKLGGGFQNLGISEADEGTPGLLGRMAKKHCGATVEDVIMQAVVNKAKHLLTVASGELRTALHNQLVLRRSKTQKAFAKLSKAGTTEVTVRQLLDYCQCGSDEEMQISFYLAMLAETIGYEAGQIRLEDIHGLDLPILGGEELFVQHADALTKGASDPVTLERWKAFHKSRIATISQGKGKGQKHEKGSEPYKFGKLDEAYNRRVRKKTAPKAK